LYLNRRQNFPKAARETYGSADRSLMCWCARGGVIMSAFNWSAIDWVSLVALSLFVLVAARIGERLSFGSRGLGALMTALLFAIGFAAWSYGLHDTVRQGIALIMPAAPPG
jgi:hypothetical protein